MKNYITLKTWDGKYIRIRKKYIKYYVPFDNLTLIQLKGRGDYFKVIETPDDIDKLLEN